MRIVFKISVVKFLNGLIDILFEKEYFHSPESSRLYVAKIRKEIEKTIHLKQKYNTPSELIKHGLYYKKFTVNKGTTWVVFYDLAKDTFYINYITNNHAPDAEFI